ncbi:MAG TPA: hypothetical protein VHP30_07515, partial [Ignavibacteriales bacterium]|nr:hypothetical protein [Ignavibacteriales bacterium]
MGFRAIIRTWSSFLIVILLTSCGYTQTIHSGIYYHQQPTSVNDSGNFYGGSKPFEGFCGPSAVGMGLQYFIPNIHAILYSLYGDISYHKDNRGGLKPRDPYCYDSSATYAFEDFLGHKYIGRHITQEGCGYYELETLIKRVDADINEYSSQTAWINRSQLSEFLDKGFLIVLNTNQGGGHYILIGGWDGSAVYPDKRFYYIWDSWKIPLGLDTTEIQYVRDLAGNKASRGSANDILVYKIAAPVLNNIFKDQIGDGTMLAFKFVPD